MTVPEKGIIIAIALLTLVASGTFFNTATIGEVEKGTKIFSKIEVKAPADPWNQEVAFREAHLRPQAKKIGAIVIRVNRNLGGFARLLQGGPNMNFANLVVFSVYRKAIDVTIEFYDTPKPRKNCLIINFGTNLRSKSRYRG